MEITTMLFIFGVILLAGTLQTMTGFAYALVAVPLLAMVTSPREAVVIVLFTGMLMKSVMVYKTWRDGNFSRIALIYAASIAGSFPGLYMVQRMDDATLKIYISIALLLCTAAMGCQFKFNIRRHRLAQAVVGIISGFLGATTAFNGPPIVLYMMNENEDIIVMRANLVRYFLLGNLTTLGLSAAMGNLPWRNLTVYALLALPAICLAWWLGEKAFKGINPTLFRRLAMTLIVLSAVITLASALAPWIRSLLG